MKWHRPFLGGLLMVSGLVSCGDGGRRDDVSSTVDIGSGGPVVAEDALKIAVKWHQDPRSEVVTCHYMKTPNDAAVEVDRLKVDFPTGSHHVHIYRSQTPEPDGAKDCSAGIDWTRWSLVVGAQTMPIDWQLPEGVTVPVSPHEQLLVQVHWLNGTDAPIDRTIDLTFRTTKRSDAHLGVVFGISKDVRTPVRAKKTVSSWCPIPPGSKVTAVMGHFHARGRRYTADLRKEGDAAGRQIYEALDEQTFQFQHYDTPPILLPGEGLAYACEYENTTDRDLTWGADTVHQEHCNLAAYYYPAVDNAPSLCVGGEVAKIDVSRTSMLPGESATGSVELQKAAGPLGVDVWLDSDPSVFDAPASVHVPPWTKNSDFAVRARRPARASIRATTGAAVLEMKSFIGGLALSEVYYRPSAENLALKQWIEIANISDATIDLFSLQCRRGGSDYSLTRAWLGTRALPPGGCVVVGGPLGLPHEDPGANVFVVAEPFKPMLGLSEDPASGVALFDVPVSVPLPSDVLPLDALVYGNANILRLKGVDGMPAQPVKGTPAKSSLARTTIWSVASTPTPGICNVPRAH